MWAWGFHGADELVEAELGWVRVHDPATEPPSPLVFDPEEDSDAILGVRLELVEAPCTVAMAEIPGPTGKEPVESADDRLDRRGGQGTGGEFAYPLPSTGHRPCRRPPGQEPQVASWGFGPSVVES